MNETLNQLFQNALDKEVFRDAEALVAKNGKIIWHKALGLAQSKALFDLSSLTKPLVVGSLFIQGVTEKGWHLRKTFGSYFKTLNLEDNTILELLEHKSGLVAYKLFLPVQAKKKAPTFRRNAQFIFRKISDDPILKRTRRPGTIYSDLGYIALGRLLERIAQEPLDQLFIKNISHPMGVEKTLLFRPLQRFKKLSEEHQFVPSGFCLRRSRFLQGEVQDVNAYVMGGVSGHAGLFGDAHSVHAYFNEWRLSEKNESKVFTKKSYDLLMQHLAQPLRQRSRFVLGFDTLSEKSRNFGQSFSREHSVCHLGYSGVSFVWDTSLDAWVILLTNRGVFGLDNPKIYNFRKKFHELVAKSLKK